MNQPILQKLRNWRSEVAQLEGAVPYRVFPNKVLEDIARLKPTSKEDLLAIKGIREKKFEKYGQTVLAIINESTSPEMKKGDPKKVRDKYQVYSVSGYLDFLNANISREIFTIRGEISSVSIKGQIYFSIKDKEDGSLLNCIMWNNVYQMCGIEVVEGMEVIICGVAEVYKPYGKLTFKVGTIQLVGEGALKKAYDKLKEKLEADGLFDESKKRAIPQFPNKIGLITSRDGAVINDFMSNVGRFGYNISFMDSRVEGIGATNDLLKAVKYFSNKDIDVLVIIRGGGSLESLQAFNNEMLVRKIAELKFPVICGIGHDKDVPLLSYVADKSVSTPTAVAQTLNKSWEQALERANLYEKTIILKYENCLKDTNYSLNNLSASLINFYQFIFERFDGYSKEIKNNISNMNQIIRHEKYKIKKIGELINAGFRSLKRRAEMELDNFEKVINQNNPERQLKLGYSIVTLREKVVRSITQVKRGDLLSSKFGDGSIESEVK